MDKLSRISRSPQFQNGSFHNLSPTTTLAKGVSIPRLIRDTIRRSPLTRPPAPLPSVKTNLHESAPEPWIVWFGHSSYLLRIGGRNILVDPVFSGHASPVSWMVKAFAGTDVYDVSDFPDIDILLITHNHYDHLDSTTLRRLAPKIRSVCTSLGVSPDIPGVDANKITELDWNQSQLFDGDISLTALPARHFSGRGLIRNKSLWSSFAVKTPLNSVYLGGDSGYDFHFKLIGDKYGPFDVAVLECGQYNLHWPQIHMMPEETVQAAIDLRARALLPVHWAKFALGLHAWDEPIRRVTEAAEKVQLSIATPMIGERITIGQPYAQNDWWNKT